MPPLELTGERTLPDVPQENYWFQRHLVVYDWIAQNSPGKRVLDLACGEGYGVDLIAQQAAEVVAVDANPEAHEHARLRYRRPNLRFERALVEDFADGTEYDRVSFLQTIEHMQDPAAVVANISKLLKPGGACYITTPNRLTLAPAGAEKSDNPWHITEYVASDFLELLTPHFASVELVGVFHARKLLLHELALRVGWDSVHRFLGLTDRFYRWFTPAIGRSDFRIGSGDLDRSLDFLAVCRV